uniref:Uncharacterized protein n=1 Tax=Arundo donax TaxID=35708 RepID=A0A0A9FYB6_ARUDO
MNSIPTGLLMIQAVQATCLRGKAQHWGVAHHYKGSAQEPRNCPAHRRGMPVPSLH